MEQLMVEGRNNKNRPLPPVEHRWKKGVSGNPRGRPKKRDSLTSLLKEEIKKVCPADRQKRTWEELMVLATLQLAMKGNATALKEIWERLDGKVLQAEKIQLGGIEGREVKIKVVYDGSPESGGLSTT
ncbi:MAG: hypothetical protein HY647_00575 [Acidobacteria bacterium]|nr:hypothetical protein [Acidobacteriota bacterium]